MLLPKLGKQIRQIQGERHITSNNRVIRISAGSNNRESTVDEFVLIQVYNQYCSVLSYIARSLSPESTLFKMK